MAPRPILRVERAHQEIRTRIVSGAYPQGIPLSEVELARSLGSSRTPIREALCRLLEEGYVERLPGRGFAVARITLKSIQDTFDVRRALESEAAAGAALRRDASALDRLRTLAPLPQGEGEGAAKAARLAKAAFHLGVAETSGNVLLVSLVRRCLDQVDRFLLHGIRVQAAPARVTVEHLEIVEAISCRDPLAAGRAMEQHLDVCRQQIVEALVAGDRQEIAV